MRSAIMSDDKERRQRIKNLALLAALAALALLFYALTIVRIGGQ
jgi:hypothetical protein